MLEIHNESNESIARSKGQTQNSYLFSGSRKLRESFVGGVPGGGVGNESVQFEGISSDLAGVIEGFDVAKGNRLDQDIANRSRIGRSHDHRDLQRVGREMVQQGIR